MSPDDPRHGTVAGHRAHLTDRERACEPCRYAKTRYEKERRYYGNRMVPALGTRRRIHALIALGHSGAEIGKALGVTYQAVHKIEHGDSAYIFATTALNVARVYDRMSMTRSTSYHAKRIRSKARMRGYAPPLAWDDIDNDPAPYMPAKAAPGRPVRAPDVLADFDWLMWAGESPERAARRVGVALATIEDYRRRVAS